MKNILFIMNDLECGGAQKSLISLLKTIDYNKYNIDLFLFKHTGSYLKEIPKEVNLLEEPSNYKYFDMPIKTALIDLIRNKKFKVLLSRLKTIIQFKIEKQPAVLEQKLWNIIKVNLNKINKNYDCAIGFMEKNPIYFCVDKVIAKKKIGWIHTNYNQMGINGEFDKLYFKNLNKIVAVSDNTANGLKQTFPDIKDKIVVIRNIILTDEIVKLANLDDENVCFDKNDINILTVGRLTYAKGYDIATRACKKIIDDGIDIRWYVIGEGDQRSNIEELIKKYNLSNNFILLGSKENPYPYMKLCSIYCQTSRFEGMGITISEAKLLKKPIITTNFESHNEQIMDNVNGIVCNLDYNDLANKLEMIIENNSLRNKLVNVLKKENISNNDEILKLYKLFEG